jgi:hypothetical protein
MPDTPQPTPEAIPLTVLFDPKELSSEQTWELFRVLLTAVPVEELADALRGHLSETDFDGLLEAMQEMQAL